MYNSQYQNNNICDLDSISVHDMDFDLNNGNQNYGQFTYGDYLQELQELEQGRTPMKIDRQTPIPRDLTNLHWLQHNIGLQMEQQQTHRDNRHQQTITLMVDPNTNMPVQFTTSRTNMQSLPSHDGIAYMTMPQSQMLSSQQHQTPVMFSRSDLHHQQMLQHQQHQKYAHERGKENGNPGHKIFPKPVFSYSCLIAMALRNSEQGSLPVSEIYKYMQSRFPYFKTAPDGWKNSVRHNLSLNKAFCKLERPDGTSQRKGCLWSLKPEKKDQLRREIRKWKKKHPEAIKASMANPDDLSLSSDSLDDDSLDDSKTPSPEHTVPESSNLDMLQPATPSSTTHSSPTPLNISKIKDEPLDDFGVETAAKELFGNDLLFNQDELQSEEFWNELITSSENANILSGQNRLLSDDLIDCDNPLKMEVQSPAISSPSSNFFSSAVQPSTLAGF